MCFFFLTTKEITLDKGLLLLPWVVPGDHTIDSGSRFCKKCADGTDWPGHSLVLR